MIRTAIPFGYLFIALFLLAAFVAGVVALVVGLRRRSARARWLGAALCAFVVIVIVTEVAYDSALEWNPTIGGDSQIVGTWTDQGQTITLASDHTFTYQTASQTARGTWTRDDWNLYLRGASYSGTMRFIQFHGIYRLMTHPPDDPDAWDGDLGLRLARH